MRFTGGWLDVIWDLGFMFILIISLARERRGAEMIDYKKWIRRGWAFRYNLLSLALLGWGVNTGNPYVRNFVGLFVVFIFWMGTVIMVMELSK